MWSTWYIHVFQIDSWGINGRLGTLLRVQVFTMWSRPDQLTPSPQHIYTHTDRHTQQIFQHSTAAKSASALGNSWPHLYHISKPVYSKYVWKYVHTLYIICLWQFSGFLFWAPEQWDTSKEYAVEQKSYKSTITRIMSQTTWYSICCILLALDRHHSPLARKRGTETGKWQAKSTRVSLEECSRQENIRTDRQTRRKIRSKRRVRDWEYDRRCTTLSAMWKVRSYDLMWSIIRLD